jgi:hypothetical protein
MHVFPVIEYICGECGGAMALEDHLFEAGSPKLGVRMRCRTDGCALRGKMVETWAPAIPVKDVSEECGEA